MKCQAEAEVSFVMESLNCDRRNCERDDTITLEWTSLVNSPTTDDKAQRNW